MDNSKSAGRSKTVNPGKLRAKRSAGRDYRGRSEVTADRYIYGAHAAEFALRNPRRGIETIWATENAERKLADAITARALPVQRVSPRELDNMVGSDAVHQGIVLEVSPLAVMELQDIAELSAASRLPIIILDQVTDPQNVGAVLRSGAVLGTAGLIMTHRHSPPLGGALAKAASGALDLTPICLVQNLAGAISELRAQGFPVIGLDGTGPHRLLEEGLRDRKGRAIGIALGAEGKGLRELTLRSCDELCRIGGDGPIASLNVSNAAAIALHLAALLRR